MKHLKCTTFIQFMPRNDVYILQKESKATSHQKITHRSNSHNTTQNTLTTVSEIQGLTDDTFCTNNGEGSSLNSRIEIRSTDALRHSPQLATPLKFSVASACLRANVSTSLAYAIFNLF